MVLQVHPAVFLLEAQLALGHRHVLFMRRRALQTISGVPLPSLLTPEPARNDKAIAFHVFRIRLYNLLANRTILTVLDVAGG